MSHDGVWPLEVRLSGAGRILTLSWSDGARHEISAELLRVESPSAEVQGHSPQEKVLVGGKRNVAIRDVREVGSYAIRLVFDDGHDTGIYSWEALRRFGEEGPKMLADYERALGERGLAR